MLKNSVYQESAQYTERNPPSPLFDQPAPVCYFLFLYRCVRTETISEQKPEKRARIYLDEEDLKKILSQVDKGVG